MPPWHRPGRHGHGRCVQAAGPAARAGGPGSRGLAPVPHPAMARAAARRSPLGGPATQLGTPVRCGPARSPALPVPAGLPAVATGRGGYGRRPGPAPVPAAQGAAPWPATRPYAPVRGRQLGLPGTAVPCAVATATARTGLWLAVGQACQQYRPAACAAASPARARRHYRPRPAGGQGLRLLCLRHRAVARPAAGWPVWLPVAMAYASAAARRGLAKPASRHGTAWPAAQACGLAAAAMPGRTAAGCPPHGRAHGGRQPLADQPRCRGPAGPCRRSLAVPPCGRGLVPGGRATRPRGHREVRLWAAPCRGAAGR